MSGRRGSAESAASGDGHGDVVVPSRQRSPLYRALALTLVAFFFVLFAALGTWQVQRRAWKLDLIARVEQRVHAPAVPAPGPAQWPQVTAAADEYRHVTATGTFLDASQTLVQAVTDLGAGYWVLTPLKTGDGSIVLVNRGFVAADDRNRVQPGGTPASTVTGLLRITEPRGGFLRTNNPAANQWYSRDVQAIAAARGLSHVAPYFIDAAAAPSGTQPANPTRPAGSPPMPQPAAAGPNPPSPDASVAPDAKPAAAGPNAPSPDASVAPDAKPAAAGPNLPSPDASVASTAEPAGAGTNAPSVGATVAPTPGLTVIRFHNSHLVYAITWYTLALMTAIAIPLGMRKP